MNDKFAVNYQDLKNHIHAMLLDSFQKQTYFLSKKSTLHALIEWSKLETFNSRKYGLISLPKLRQVAEKLRITIETEESKTILLAKID